jgi:hypothetical protein
VGPLQYSNSFNYIFTIIDCISKWMEAIPLSETSAVACAKALIFTWISHFRVPETITSDRVGCNLLPTFGFNFAKCLTFRTSKHPEANSAVERLHRRLKDALHARVAAATWSEEFTLCAPWTQSTAEGRQWSFPG